MKATLRARMLYHTNRSKDDSPIGVLKEKEALSGPRSWPHVTFQQIRRLQNWSSASHRAQEYEEHGTAYIRQVSRNLCEICSAPEHVVYLQAALLI